MKKSVWILLLMTIFLMAGLYKPQVYGAGRSFLISGGLPSDGGEIYQGIDVSQWQGYVDFSRVYGSGIRVVYVRAGEGSSYIDPFWERNFANAKAAGLKVGAYYFVTARTASQARQQAHQFAVLLEGKALDCRPAMDFEVAEGLSDAEYRQVAAVFLESLREYTGKDVLIYSDITNARRLDASFSVYPLWVAEYGVSEVEDPYFWNSWAGWQYSDNGRVAGISGAVDRDYFTSGVFLSDTSACPSPGVAPPAQTVDYVYTVRYGDTLWGISQRFHTTVAALAADNHIADPNLIYVGEKLNIQTSEKYMDQPNVLRYTIRPGDTLWSIVQRYRTTVAQLVAENDIRTPNLIYAGQVLKIID